MTIDFIRSHCLALPGVTEDIKWEHNLCFSVAGKIFMITHPDELPLTVSFKVEDGSYEAMIAAPGIGPAPYLARNKWVMVTDAALFSRADWVKFIETSYWLIREKLPAKIKKGL